jgi:hypothetical protein
VRGLRVIVSLFGASKRSCVEMANCRLLSALTGESARPGEDPTGASAEREGGFDPQSEAELAQGEYKGAREVLARHGNTAQPRGGPGVC